MSSASEPDADLPPLPDAFVRRMRERLDPSEAEALLRALDGPAEPGLRVQHDRIDVARLRELVDWRLEPVPWTPHGYYVDAAGDAPGAHGLHEAGAFYLQDPSAMAPAAALAVRPGERVIDLAAAPGGKATALLADLAAAGDDADGVLVANDVHPTRVGALARNLERVGARNALVSQRTPAEWARIAPGSFDAVLLDAPCSGEGMFRKSAAARDAWSEETVAACAARQSELLSAAAELLAPGGRLVYATCTFAPEENEEVVAALLERRPDLVPGSPSLPGTDPAWTGHGASRATSRALQAIARIWPHRARGDGHVVTLLQRADDGVAAGPAEPEARTEAAPDRGVAASTRRSGHGGSGRRPRGGDRAPRRTPSAADGPTLAAWRAFAEEALRAEGRRALAGGGPHDDGAAGDSPERLVVQGEVLWRRAGPATWQGPGVLRPGLALGRVRGGRFVPAHALAQALRPGEARVRLDLPVGGPWLDLWMAGEELTWSELLAAGAQPVGASSDLERAGWVQVAVAGCGLGWGRRSGDRLRNLYPKGLRRRR